MSKIRGSNTAPELLLRGALWRLGLRYRTSAKLPGRPDIAFITARVAVFMDGCFWHGCEQHLIWPKNNAAFWRHKILENKIRDNKVDLELHRAGWRVIRLWEHEVRNGLARCVQRIAKSLSHRATLSSINVSGNIRPALRLKRAQLERGRRIRRHPIK